MNLNRPIHYVRELETRHQLLPHFLPTLVVKLHRLQHKIPQVLRSSNLRNDNALFFQVHLDEIGTAPFTLSTFSLYHVLRTDKTMVAAEESSNDFFINVLHPTFLRT